MTRITNKKKRMPDNDPPKVGEVWVNQNTDRVVKIQRIFKDYQGSEKVFVDPIDYEGKPSTCLMERMINPYTWKKKRDKE